MRFIKMEGAGNDYVYVDCFAETIPEPAETLAPKIADRHFGVGGDGLVLILPTERADARMRMFNPDGSESEMCGNAVRCVAKYVRDSGLISSNPLTIETGKGVLSLECFPAVGPVERVCVDMGEPILVPSEIPTTLRSLVGGPNAPVIDVPLEIGGETFAVTCVSMGNPHAVIFAEPNDAHVLEAGPRIERCEWFPRRANVEFARIGSRSEIQMRVWERGTGETLACGTGACATAVAAVLSGRCDRRVVIHLTGGDLEIEWVEGGSVFMTGPAREVFRGQWP